MIEEITPIKTKKRERAASVALLFIVPLILILLLEGYSRNSFGSMVMWIRKSPFLFLCNYALMLSVYLMLYVFKKESTRAAIVVVLGLLASLLGMANYYKMLYRMEPVFLTDITQVRDAMATLTGMQFDIDTRRIIAWCVCSVVVLVIALIGLKKYEHRRRWIPALIGLAMLVWLPTQYTFKLANGTNRYDMVDHAKNEGSLYTLIAMENHRHDLMRLDYKEEDVRSKYRQLQEGPGLAEGGLSDGLADGKSNTVPPNEALADGKSNDDPNPNTVPPSEARQKGEAPNVIFVLAESFADEAYLSKYLNLTQSLTPFYDTLMDEALSGQLYVPKIGGGTSETEFEVLTGMKSQYAINPYSMGLPPTSSVASVLGAKGYEATALHWYAGVYYNRYNNLKMLGFDSFHTTDTSAKDFQKTGMFVSDEEHFSSVMNQLRSTEERDFIFTLTMQNHGGYEYDDFRETYGASQLFSDQLTPASEVIVNNFCYLVTQTDIALEKFIQELRAFQEPTIVVFFSDHIPPFGRAVFDELGISMQDDTSHLTPYFIWSNDENLSEHLDLKAYQLGAHALTIAGLNDDPFLHYVEELRAAGVADDSTYDLLSYDALFGKQYAYNEGNLSPKNENFQIGGEMKLLSIDTAVIDERIYLRPNMSAADQKFKLEVNGKKQDTYMMRKTDQPIEIRCVLANSSGQEYNHSNTLVFENSDDLVGSGGYLSSEKISLTNCEFELVEGKKSDGFYLFQSKDVFSSKVNTAMVSDGEFIQWQPIYGIVKAGQYGFDEQKKLTISVGKKSLPEPTPEALGDLLAQKNTILYIFSN
ncbi:MAG: sulfatase-like hydrolase/transferase [Clostridiales bacterium]|nr:sulfatase-like hydrolase/transferase [Clostridiales bacterium]